MIVAEGEFKALSLWRLARLDSSTPRFVPIACAGVWNFLGTVGRSSGPNGDRRDVKGIIPDVETIVWKNRRVIIAYDADTKQNGSVTAARQKLSSVLIERGATIGYLDWPIEHGKGIDDWLASKGPDDVLCDWQGRVQ